MNRNLIGLIAFTVVALVIVSALTLGRRRHSKLYQGFEDGTSGSGGSGGGGGKFTMYYAEWCPHCQSVKPDFQQFMGNGTVNVNGKSVQVDLVQPEKEPEKAAGVNVKGYPTFLYSDSAGKTVEFAGPRTPDGYMTFLKQQVLS